MGIAYALIRFKNWTDHVIIDRSWIHGTTLDETMRGINLGGGSYVGIVDSYFGDFHCIAKTGACTDAQAIIGGNSNVPVGVYKIVNNSTSSSLLATNKALGSITFLLNQLGIPACDSPRTAGRWWLPAECAGKDRLNHFCLTCSLAASMSCATSS